MYVRELAKRHWAEARLYDRHDPRLKEFLTYIDANPAVCWGDAVAVFRKRYYGLYDHIVPPLLNSNDKLLRVQFIRHTDPSKPKELRTLQRLVREADPVADRPELNAILSLKHPALRQQIAERTELAAIIAHNAAPPPRPVTNVIQPEPAPKDGLPQPREGP